MARNLTQSERERFFKDVAEKVKLEKRKERAQKLATIKGEITRAFPQRVTRKKQLRTLKKVPTRLKGAKQPKFATAATKFVSALAPSGAFTGIVTTGKGVDSGRGRGRPAGTFKARYLPDGRIVRVPTHIYKKMLSEVKARQRLAIAQKQAQARQQFEAEQLARSQDPRFQPSEDEGFLEEPDMAHEQRVEMMRQQQLMQQQAQQVQQPGTLGSRLKQIIRGNRQPQFGEQPFQEQPFQEQPIQQQFQQPIQQPRRDLFQRRVTVDPHLHRPVNPQVSIISERSSILNAPNTFGHRELNPVGFSR